MAERADAIRDAVARVMQPSGPLDRRVVVSPAEYADPQAHDDAATLGFGLIEARPAVGHEPPCG